MGLIKITFTLYNQQKGEKKGDMSYTMTITTGFLFVGIPSQKSWGRKKASFYDADIVEEYAGQY